MSPRLILLLLFLIGCTSTTGPSSYRFCFNGFLYQRLRESPLMHSTILYILDKDGRPVRCSSYDSPADRAIDETIPEYAK